MRRRYASLLAQLRRIDTAVEDVDVVSKAWQALRHVLSGVVVYASGLSTKCAYLYPWLQHREIHSLPKSTHQALHRSNLSMVSALTNRTCLGASLFISAGVVLGVSAYMTHHVSLFVLTNVFRDS